MCLEVLGSHGAMDLINWKLRLSSGHFEASHTTEPRIRKVGHWKAEETNPGARELPGPIVLVNTKLKHLK